MSDLKSKFEAAVAASKQLAKRPSDANMLALYAHYKQATEGDVSGEAPDSADRVASAKYDAWDRVSGMSKDAAMQAYVDLVAKLQAG